MNTYNAYTLFDIPVFIYRYFISAGVVVIIALILTALLIHGINNYKKVQREKMETGGFSLTQTKYVPGRVLFSALAKALDYAISQWITFIHKKTHKSILKLLDFIIPDSLLESVFGLKRNFKERVEFMNREFPVVQNNFWHHTKRAPDLLNRSPILSGRWFNGEKIEKYLPFLISTRSFYIFIKSGIAVAFLSFVVLALLYHPQVFYGYQPDSVRVNAIRGYEDRIIENPTLLPQYRRDIWSTAEYNEIKKDVSANATAYATSLFESHNTQEGSKWGWIIYNGYITSLLLALAIGLSFIRYKYYNAFRILGIGYIRDTHEDYKYQQKVSEIEAEKRNLSAQNLRATGYDADSPLITFASSTGDFEKKGLIGAYRKGDPIFLSALDMSQNTLLYGSTGTGKSRSVIIPIAQGILLLKSKYLSAEERFASYYDTRRNELTEKAISENYLKEYKKLPYPKNVISCGIMDIKSQLWKDLKPEAERLYLQKTFLIVGAKVRENQLAIDILKGLNPVKLVGFLNSINVQMGGENAGDFWGKTALIWAEKFAWVAYGFARTDAGIRYLQQKKIKPWSLAFLYEIICLDSNNELLAHCINAISQTIEEKPEQIADILNQDMVNAMHSLLNEWVNLDEAKETKLGVQINLSTLMSTYSNSALRPFLTGVGTNMCEIGDLWQKIVAFDLNTDDYGVPGKMVLVFLKNLMYEEAARRQIRFSNRLVSLNRYFREAYPEMMVLENSPESIPMDLLDMTEVGQSLSTDAKLRDDFIEKAYEIQHKIGVEEDWMHGTYLSNIKSILATRPVDDFELAVAPYTPEVYELCEQAVAISANIFQRNPRFEEKLGGMVDIDTSVFKSDINDSKEVAELKQKNLKLYYEYEELSTRLKREHFFFFGDEFQELISIDPNGVCYTDANFPNVSRSTNFKLFVATQTKSAFVMKVGQETLDNFSSQFRSRIYLPNEDKMTLEEMETLAGETDVFINPHMSQELKAYGVPVPGYRIYDNLNSLISHAIERNRVSEFKCAEYPYDYDVFAKAEPVDIDFGAFTFDRPLSSIFDLSRDFNIPSLKNHFLDLQDIGKFKERGSNNSEITNNEEQLLQAWKQAKQSATDKYETFLERGYENKAKLLPVSSIVSFGNLHGLMITQRAGVTRKDHIIVAPVGDYIRQDD